VVYLTELFTDALKHLRYTFVEKKPEAVPIDGCAELFYGALPVFAYRPVRIGNSERGVDLPSNRLGGKIGRIRFQQQPGGGRHAHKLRRFGGCCRISRIGN